MSPHSDQPASSRHPRSDSAIAHRLVRQEPAMAPDAGQFKAYLHVLLVHGWLIILVAAVTGLMGLLYALGAQSVYESNMTIQVDETTPNGAKNVLSEAASLFDAKRVTVAEMEMLRSRLVLAPVVEALHLDLEVRPRYFPLVGAAIARARGASVYAPGWLGHGSYAWGAEQLAVSSFSVPAALQQRTFVVTAAGPGSYHLADQQGRLVGEGKVGTPLLGSLDGQSLALQVDALQARAGVQFLLRRGSKQAAVARIQAGLRIAEQGKQSGVIDVKLEGEAPALVHAILDATVREYLRQATARKREDAEKSLAFLDAQLLTLRIQLQQSEARYSQFQRHHGTVSLAEETRIGVEQAAATKARRAELLQRKAQLASRYTNNHPVIVGIDNQLQALDQSAREANAALRDLAAIDQDEASMTRDARAKSELYNSLSATAQQLRILAASSASNVHLIDAPTLPEAPIKPNRALIVSAAVIAGLLLGMVAAVVRRAAFSGIDGPETIEKILGARVVHVSIPYSHYQRRLSRHAQRGMRHMPMLARVAPEDPAVEALRGFRAALQFLVPRFRNNIAMIAGPTAGLGKSFLSANAATVIAASGKRVLLIDADLRDGQLHRYFETVSTPGLQDAVRGSVPLIKAIRRDVMKNLDFIAAGAAPGNPSECLTHANFSALLVSVSEKYDLVIIDAPRVLGVADALIIGAHVGAVFLLARAGVTTADEISETMMRLNQAGIVPEGVLFNGSRARRGAPGYQSRAVLAEQVDYAGTP